MECRVSRQMDGHLFRSLQVQLCLVSGARWADGFECSDGVRVEIGEGVAVNLSTGFAWWGLS